MNGALAARRRPNQTGFHAEPEAEFRLQAVKFRSKAVEAAQLKAESRSQVIKYRCYQLPASQEAATLAQEML